ILVSSLEFWSHFLPLTLLAYFAAPFRGKGYVLLIASLIFYGIAQPSLLPLLLFVCLLNYALGFFIYTLGDGRGANILVGVAVIANAGILLAFKYLDPMLMLFGFEPLGIELPVGISFYIFQALSYVLDVRRHVCEAQKNPFLFVAYVSLFPQLVAGPIVRYSDVATELKKRKHSLFKCVEGVRLFAVGLAKKLLLANGAGESYERLARYSEHNGTVLGAWLCIIFFSFQIYFDFSGYSDMARGLGRIFAFEFPENFRYPYVSRSITEFWRRWHITLSSWFREYVYIPLGGNRRGIARTYLNLLAVWLLTGIWHGAAVNFLLWGLYFFVIIALEKTFILKLIDRAPRFFGHAYALMLILIGWLIFESNGTLGDGRALLVFGQMLGVGCSLWSNDALFELLRNIPFLLIMAIGCTPFAFNVFAKLRLKRPLAFSALANALSVFLLIICTCYIVDSGYNPFLYFRF
ncbi:MAG: MBOAT family protein, partial [Clostridia bacterium]|nr:MBOAT family protein [Clostridia bacterium]